MVQPLSKRLVTEARLTDIIKTTTDTAIAGVAVVTPAAAPSGGDDRSMIQAILNANPGGKVQLRRGTYIVSNPLSIPAGVTLQGEGNGATTIKLANGANCDVIQSANLTTWLVAQVTAALPSGTAVTSIPVTALARNLTAGDTLQLGYAGAGQVATVAAGGATAGATSVTVNSFTPALTVPAGACVVANPTESYAAGVPYGFGLVGVTIDGNRANNTAGRGVAFYGFRYNVDDVYIYSPAESGFVSAGALGTTGGYPKGQVETSIGTMWIRGAGGAGFHYEAPHDGYADQLFIASCDGNGAEIGGLDGNYIHSYGCLQGVLMQGFGRWNHIQVENSRNEGLVTATASTPPNRISTLTAFDNWTSGTATKDNYSIRCDVAIHIGHLGLTCSRAESGVYLGGAHSRINTGRVIGVLAANTSGLWLNATDIDVNVDVSSWSTGITRNNSNNSDTRIVAQISQCQIGFYERGPSAGSTYEVIFNAATNTQSPWVLAAGSTATNYRLSSYNAIISSYSASGGISNVNQVSANQLTAGEATLPRWGAVSQVTMGSGVVRFGFFTASKTEAINNLAACTGGTAAGATPTYAAMGIYSVAANGDLTLVASTANDTTLFSTGNATHTRATVAAYTKVAGQRYALAVLVVSGATMPNLVCANFAGGSSEMSGRAPILTASLSGQSALPASITSASLGTASQMLYGVVTP